MKYRVGKTERYEAYVLEALALMYEAGLIYFTLPELASWTGLPYSTSLRLVCDRLVLRGWLHVSPHEVQIEVRARTYSLQSPVWLTYNRS